MLQASATGYPAGSAATLCFRLWRRFCCSLSGKALLQTAPYFTQHTLHCLNPHSPSVCCRFCHVFCGRFGVIAPFYRSPCNPTPSTLGFTNPSAQIHRSLEQAVTTHSPSFGAGMYCCKLCNPPRYVSVLGLLTQKQNQFWATNGVP